MSSLDEKEPRERRGADDPDRDSPDEYAYESEWYEVLKRRAEEQEQEQEEEDEAADGDGAEV